MKPYSTSTFTAYVGIDWADKKHDFCLRAMGSDVYESGILEHTPQAIALWAQSLHERFGGPIAVCLELTKGPLVYALQRHDFFVIFPVHPSTLARYRQAFTPSGAKDDPSDARTALDILQRHPEQLEALQPSSQAMRMLSVLVEERRRLTDGVTRITNRLTSTLKQYYPQPLDWFEHRNTAIFCDFLSRWPSLAQVRRARTATLESFFRAHNCRRAYLVNERIAGIRAATPLTEDEAVIRPARMVVETLVAQLRVSLEAIERFDAEIDCVAQSLADYALFASLPGAGPIQTPRLLVAFGEDRSRFANAGEIQRYAGIAPVLERSGNRSWVHWRYACSTFLRQTLVEWAGSTIPRSYWAGLYYHQQRAKGSSHGMAVRALAFKWIRILFKMWKTGTAYDESTYLKALSAHGSSLVTTPMSDANTA